MNSNMEAKIKKSEQLARIIGHPVHILMLENKAIAGLFPMPAEISRGAAILRNPSVHYRL